MGGWDRFIPHFPSGGVQPSTQKFPPPIRVPVSEKALLVRAREPWSLRSGVTALRGCRSPRKPHQPDQAWVGATRANERGLHRKRRRGGPRSPLSSSGSPPARRPSLATRQEQHRGARGDWERRPGGLQLGRPRRRRAGRVRTAGAPDLAGGGVSKALCLMASVYRVTL